MRIQSLIIPVEAYQVPSTNTTGLISHLNGIFVMLRSISVCLFFASFDMIRFSLDALCARRNQRNPRTDPPHHVQPAAGCGRSAPGNQRMVGFTIKVLLINFDRISTGVIHFTPFCFPLQLSPLFPVVATSVDPPLN